MHTIIARYDEPLLEELIRFRQKVYLGAGRGREQLSTWASDRYDELAFHVVSYSSAGEIVGAARLLESVDWTLDHRFSYAYDADRAFEIGRLGVASEFNRAKDIFGAMLTALVTWSRAHGYDRCYGFTIVRFILGLKRYGVPFDILSPTLCPYGEPTQLLGFLVSDLEAYVRGRKKWPRKRFPGAPTEHLVVDR